ncbi:MAG TPA: ribonuclease H-like domain-containing protein [Candidatus Limnocylindrales bacterium]
MTDTALLGRRLAALRAARGQLPAPRPGPEAPTGRSVGASRAERLAAAVGGEWLSGPGGHVVRVEPETIALPLERARLASLPGQPPADARLVCLDTETTGLGTAAGTLAFLVGIGWWEGDRFRQVQLVCPDHGNEAALLAAVEAAIPPDSWLVTYNGRGFDWPLLVTRYRLMRRPAPVHAGMLDLLPHVRRLFRHRLGDARLATVERELLGVRRDGDVASAEIPERYLAFVHGGSAEPLAPVVTHNAEDVRSLGRLLVHLDRRYADPDRRRHAPAGDLVALARGYTRERRHHAALECLDEADAGWRPPSPGSRAWPGLPPTPLVTVSRERIRAERARTLRRLGRPSDAATAWEALAVAGGPGAAHAWVEVAKVREHVLGDHAGALAATAAAERAAERSRLLGIPCPTLEPALAMRRRRLDGRLQRARDEAFPGDARTGRRW